MTYPIRAALGLGASVLILGACTPPPHHGSKGPLKALSSLTCPASQGELKLQGAATPAACAYVGEDGSEVSLKLVALNGQTSEQALKPFQQQAQDALPALASPAGGGATASSTSSGPSDDKVDIDLPGIHIHTNGDHVAQVNAGGVHVDADDREGHRALVSTSGFGHDHVVVNASDGGARINVQESGAGVRSSFILAADKPGPNGWRLAGYEARGPSSGPIVVATLLSKSDEHEDLRHDVKDLLVANVGR